MTPRRAAWAGAVLGIVALLYPLLRLNLGDDESFGYDLRLLWLAGRAWSEGESAYGPAFDALYAQAFGGQIEWHVFNYPPHFIVVAAPLSWAPFGLVRWAWLLLNLACAITSAWLLTATLPRSWARFRIPVAAAVLAFALTHQAGPYTLLYGQTSFIVLLGASAFFHGYALRAPGTLTAGLILLSLKPNIGLLPGLLVVAESYDLRARTWRRWAVLPVLGSAAFVGLGTVLAMFAGGGAGQTLAGFAERVRTYTESPPCAPFNMTGPPYLADTFLDAAFPLALSLGLALLVGGRLAWRAPSRELRALCVLAVVFFFLPLHTYDLVAGVALVPLLWSLPGARAAVASAALLVLHRSSSLSLGLNPDSWFAGLLAATLAAAVLVLACVEPRPPRPTRHE